MAVFKTTRSSVARDVIARIGDVYAIEARIRGRTAEARRTVRQAETKPILEALVTARTAIDEMALMLQR